MVLVIYLYTLEIVTIELCFHFMQIISVKNSQRESCDLDQELPVIILITPFFTFTGTWRNVIINRAQAYPHTIHSNDSTNEYTCTWMATKWENIEFWFRQWRQTECSLKIIKPWQTFFRKYTLTAQPKVALPCNRKIRVVSILIYIGHISQQKIHW